MNTTGHTKTPWKIGKVNELRIEIESDNNNEIDFICELINCTDEDMPNALFIVKCVNNHDKLVEALKEARKYINRVHKIVSPDLTGLGVVNLIKDTLLESEK